ncbi:MAG: hypothetical protein JXA37_13780 [Chloroflexia bacterium]|nr:hypothetical protein [Chloroflexia bacterium]
MTPIEPLTYQEYRPRKIVNVHKHVDGPWFWGKYSAHPYVGCRSGCAFCYCRGGRYLGRRDPATFNSLIQVKVNAVELLRQELAKLPRDIIACGDWQHPAECKYLLSRKMLDVVHEFKFPLFVVERSPLLARDLDLLVEIDRQSWVGVAYSISTLNPALKRAFEPHSPSPKQRLQTMERLAAKGIQVGTALMPILPCVGDSETHLEEVVRATREHGGSFVMAGGLTMDGLQAQTTLEAARRLEPALEARWRGLYDWAEGGKPSYSPAPDYAARIGLLVRELCERHGLADRLPRYVLPDHLADNKRIAEKLFLQTYELELQQARSYRVWAYRKAAWTVDELDRSIGTLYRERGEAGLRELPHVGQKLAARIAGWLEEEKLLPPTGS